MTSYTPNLELALAPNLEFALALLAASAVAIGGLIALFVWRARRRNSKTVLMDVAARISIVWIALTAVGVLVLLPSWFLQPNVMVAHLPLITAWPSDLPCLGEPVPASSATATSLYCASVNTATASITNLSTAATVVLASADLLALVVAVFPAIVVLVICNQAREGTPFSALTSRWLFIGAGVILIAGIGSTVLNDIGSTMAAAEVLPQPGAGTTTAAGIATFSIPYWPLGAAGIAALMGTIFRHGAQLQRDTDGLV
ncbi:hypothetical protein [Microbacterium marmarense]|uniref:DUF2975 domain-containing protein n=1 Tax=Microbacterium marmarense TaxID=3122051 RepID=A0ABU8LRE7_9MICO